MIYWTVTNVVHIIENKGPKSFDEWTNESSMIDDRPHTDVIQIYIKAKPELATGSVGPRTQA